MMKEKEVKINITHRNKNQYIDKYEFEEFNKKYLIKIEDINHNSKERITAICAICGQETNLSIQKYYKNYNKYNFYTCRKCSSIKNKKTNLKKYGVEYPLQSKEIYNKLKKTIKKKYGVDNIFQLEEIKEKSIKTTQKHYGVDYHLQNKEQLKKQETTNLKRYGVKRPAQNEQIKLKISIKKFQLFNKHQFNFLMRDGTIFYIKCDKCNKIYEICEKTFYCRLKYNVEMCVNCNPINSHKSGKEIKMFDFIKENYNGKIITSDRKILDGKEIDILLPDINLGFEFNGTYWHSEKYKLPGYHFSKSRKALKKGIKLYHIWEEQWDNEYEKIKLFIIDKIISNNS